VKCTVLAGADGATKAVGLLETDSVSLVVDRARPVFDHCLFYLVIDARYKPESITDLLWALLFYWVKYCEDKRPGHQLEASRKQHNVLCKRLT